MNALWKPKTPQFIDVCVRALYISSEGVALWEPSQVNLTCQVMSVKLALVLSGQAPLRPTTAGAVISFPL